MSAESLVSSKGLRAFCMVGCVRAFTWHSGRGAFEDFYAEQRISQRFAADEPHRLVILVNPLHQFQTKFLLLAEELDAKLRSVPMDEHNVTRAVLAKLRQHVFLAENSKLPRIPSHVSSRI